MVYHEKFDLGSFWLELQTQLLFDGGINRGAGSLGVGLRAIGSPFEGEVEEARKSGFVYYRAIGGLLDRNIVGVKISGQSRYGLVMELEAAPSEFDIKLAGGRRFELR